MYNEDDFSGLFGPSDERFRTSYNNTLAKLRTDDALHPARQRHWKMIAVIVFICVIAMTGVAVAVSQYNMRVIGRVDDVDIGAAWKLISVPEDYYESIGEPLPILLYWYSMEKKQLPQLTEEEEQAMRVLLADKVFISDGEPFDLLALDQDSNEYVADSRGFTLYNESGEELAEITYYYNTIGRSGEPLGLVFRTKAEVDAQREAELSGQYGTKITSDYEEASQLLGQEFRLPTIYTDSLDAPEYKIQEGFTAIISKEENGSVVYEYGDTYGTAVYVRMSGDPGIYYFAEAKTRDDTISRKWYAPGALIEECAIAEQTVYKITTDEIIRYAWELDGLVYMIFQDRVDPNEFTDEQFVEIIWSMIQ